MQLLIFCVQSGHTDEQCVRVRGFHNKASQKFLKINKTVTADEDDFRKYFANFIKIRNHALRITFSFINYSIRSSIYGKAEGFSK